MINNLITISFLGDISFNDKYNDLYKKNCKPFKKISKVLIESDCVIGNLECISKGDSGENLLKRPRLKTNLETLNYLKDLNIKIVTLAHNHVYDNLLDGYMKTIGFLTNSSIPHIGAGLSYKEAGEPIIIEYSGIEFCFLNYVTKDTNPKLPNNSRVYLNWFDEKRIKEHIKYYRDTVDFIIILLHWGEKLEGGYYPDFEQPQIARRLIDAGADLIVGHHSHTLQPYEIYRKKYIFYSLGNFCFSDISFDGELRKINQKECESIILKVVFTKDSYRIEIIPIINKNLSIELEEEVLKKYKKRIFYFKFIQKIKIIWNFYFFKYKYIDPVILYFRGNHGNFLERLRLLNWGKIRKYVVKA